MSEVSDDELIVVIKDFLEMGYVDNIVAMFDQEPRYFDLTGRILDDERFNVRLGVSVLFEELQLRGCEISMAIHSLVPLLDSSEPHIRGEALSILGIIASPETYPLITRMTDDPQPQVAEIANEIAKELEIAHNIS
ncbi:MAG: HEAT repeat domain-containing protein [Desulfobulbaceae bacterium]|nr:MAG: HEAT repeat domain-containing protein [Desulfobulbaceae bacterium]